MRNPQIQSTDGMMATTRSTEGRTQMKRTLRSHTRYLVGLVLFSSALLVVSVSGAHAQGSQGAAPRGSGAPWFVTACVQAPGCPIPVAQRSARVQADLKIRAHFAVTATRLLLSHTTATAPTTMPWFVRSCVLQPGCPSAATSSPPTAHHTAYSVLRVHVGSNAPVVSPTVPWFIRACIQQPGCPSTPE